MDLLHIVLLLGAGVIGGTISSLVGGAAVITFPALLATGISPVVATVTNMVALVPGNLAAAFYDRSQLPPFDRHFIRLIIASLIGAGAGAAVLLITPERAFEALVPVLLGFATILFAFAGRISAWIRAQAEARGHEPRIGTTNLAVLLPVSVYGGYFGAGVGVLLLGVLSIGTGGDYRSANVTKNLVTSLNSLVASALFVSQGAVWWPAALVMMTGAIVGAFIGARLAQIVPRDAMRIVVVAVGAALTVAFAWRYWI